MKSPKSMRYDDLTLLISRNVYEPAEDTVLAADNLIVNEHDRVLDMGTGCGILAVLAARRAKHVIAVDINPHAVHCAKRNAVANNLASRIDVIRGDLFQPVHKDEKFSLIVFNAPYLPSTPREARSWLGKAWAGGTTGRRVIDRFMVDAPHYLGKEGRILLVQSSLADVDATLRRFTALGLDAHLAASRKVAFETIVLVEAKPFIRTLRKSD